MRIFVVTFAMLAAFLTSGCATLLTLKAISPGDEKEIDSVSDVKTAWRDEAGNVTLCVTGTPADANYYFFFPRYYSIQYPGASSPALKVLFHDSIPEYPVTAADVKGRCPQTMEGMAALPIHRVHAREFGDGNYFKMSDEALAAFFENRAEAPAIYMFGHRWTEYDSGGTMIVYVHEVPLHNDARAVHIATWSRKVEGRLGHVLLLPFALVFDVVSFPVQLLFALTYHG